MYNYSFRKGTANYFITEMSWKSEKLSQWSGINARFPDKVKLFLIIIFNAKILF